MHHFVQLSSVLRTRLFQTRLAIVTAILLVASGGHAQSMISNDPFEIDFGKGTWGVFLPDYELGSSTGGGPAFEEDMDVPGFIMQLKSIRRFLGTRTSFETRGFYAFAGANSLSQDGDLTLPNPATGVSSIVGSGRGHLESDISHYGGDMLLRDTWHTRFGGLSAGIAAAYFAFDQDFEASLNRTRLYEESLESDFTGGKGFVGWDGYLIGRPSNIDFLFGYFDVDSEYEYRGRSLPGSRRITGGGNTGTIEINATTRETFNIGTVGLTIGALYISEMPSLIQDNGPTTIGDEPAGTITAMVEWIF